MRTRRLIGAFLRTVAQSSTNSILTFSLVNLKLLTKQYSESFSSFVPCNVILNAMGIPLSNSEGAYIFV